MEWGPFIAGAVRHVMTFGGGYFVERGLATDADVQTAIAGVVAIIGLGWSIWQKKQSAQS